MDGLARRSTPGFLFSGFVFRRVGSKSTLRSAGRGDVPIGSCERDDDL
jgi:hypothetical protein